MRWSWLGRCLLLFIFALVSLEAPVWAKERNKSKRKSKVVQIKRSKRVKSRRSVNKAYAVTANSAILIDAANQHRYYGKDIYQPVIPASTTKLMTAILVMESLSLDDFVTVSPRAVRVQPSKLEVRPSEQYRVKDLMYALLLKSANDAAMVLAEAVAGSEDQFVDMMNQRARQLGAKHTHFVNPHGLPSDKVQYTTAYDMTLILKEALSHPFVQQALTFKYRMIYSKDGRQFVLKSHNKSMFLGWQQPVYGKTGYTNAAKSCFVGYVDKGPRRLYVAVFGCRKRWDDIQYIIERYGQIDL